MTKYLPLVRVSAISLFVDFLDDIGTPTETLMKQCKVPIYAFENQNSLISSYQAFNFIDTAASQEDIANLGLIVGAKNTVESLGILGRLISQCFTLYDGILTGIYVGNYFNSCERLWLLEKGDKAYFCQNFIPAKGLILDHVCHFSLMMMIKLIQKVAGEHWYPQNISLQTDFPNFGNHPLQQTQINRDVTINSVEFPRHFLSLPLPSPNHHFSPEEDYHHLYQNVPSSLFSHRLALAITPFLKESYPTLKMASKIANLSPRSLQRKLWKEGLTYEKLLDRIRYDLAIIMLKDRTMRIIDIAYELGYKDPSHFTRAFKRWTGKSPKVYYRSFDKINIK